MGVFLDRKIFVGAGGGGDLNVNGALGLTTGVAGENLLENDLVFKSPDVITDWTVSSDFIADSNILSPHFFTFNNKEYVVAGYTTEARTLKFYTKNNLNEWSLLLSYVGPSSLFSSFGELKPVGIVPVNSEEFIVIALKGNGTIASNREDKVFMFYFNTTSNTITDELSNSRLNEFDEVRERSVYGLRYIIENNIIYFIHYITSYDTFAVNSTSLRTEKGWRISSFDIINKTFIDGTFQTYAYRSSSPGQLSPAATTFDVALIEESGVISAFFRRRRVTTTSDWFTEWRTFNFVDLTFTSNNPVVAAVAQPDINNNGLASRAYINLHKLNNKIYLIAYHRVGSRIFEKTIGGAEPFVLLQELGSSDVGVPFATFPPNNHISFVYNGMLYLIILLTTSPFFVSFVFIDDAWVLLQAPILPFEQNYGGFHIIYDGQTMENIGDLIQIDNNKIRFVSKNTSVSPFNFLWESTTDGIFSPEWIKNQQLFTDAIGITQETKNINETISVYQMTPDNSL